MRNRQFTINFNLQDRSFSSVFGTLFLILGAAFSVFAANGLDTSFGTDGKTVMVAGGGTTGTSTAFATAIDAATGKIYAVGSGVPQTTTNTGISIARLNADGSPDSTFGASGRRIVNFTGFSSTGRGIVVLADGSAVAVGNISDGSAAVVKLTSAGNLDAAFATGGAFTSVFGTSGASLNAVALQPDGTIIAAGSAGGNFVLAKFTSAGALDATFGAGGFVTTDFGGSDVAAGVVVQTDGKIVAGGRTGNATALARFNVNGSLDTSFGTNGKVTSVIVTNGNPGYPNEILLQPDGKIVGIGIAAPTGQERHLLIRYNSNGTLDNSFGTNGVAGGYFGNSQEFLQGGKILADGKILVVGYIGLNATIARYNADGSVDRGFLCGGFGWVYFNTNLTFGYFYDVVVQSDGKYVAVGQATSPSVSQNSFAFARFNAQNAPTQCPASDFDRDGKADVSVIRPNNNGGGNSAWYRALSSGINILQYPYVYQWGVVTDKYVPADYNGDGQTDIAIFRDGNWWIHYSSPNIGIFDSTVQFGIAGDIPAPGDFDGDGKADFAVFRPSDGNWWILKSSNGQNAVTHWGTTGDIPVTGDYDGDFKTDLTVFRPSNGTWYILRSSDNQAQISPFGLNGDVPLKGDFNGDGKSDLSVFRPSDRMWYIARPNGVPAQNFDAVPFGLGSDTPSPSDYDGDGKTDIAVYRNGAWFILQSSNGQIQYPQFGLAGDKPTMADLIP